jgi:predicted ester cyclase
MLAVEAVMPETIDDIKATARRIWEEIIPSSDTSALPDVMHPNSVDYSARPDEPPGIDGVVSTMRWLHSVFSDLTFDIHHVIGEADTVAVHCTLTGRHTGDLMGIPPTNRAVAIPMVHIVRFRNGKVAKHWAVHDDTAAMRQLGVLPAGPQQSRAPVPAGG